MQQQPGWDYSRQANLSYPDLPCRTTPPPCTAAVAILRVEVEPEHLQAFLAELRAGGLERLEKPWRVQMSFRWGSGWDGGGWVGGVGDGRNSVDEWVCFAAGRLIKTDACARPPACPPARRRLHYQPGIDALQPYTQHQRLDADW